ncbi:trypco2 family protein [Actinoplanes sp. NPDC049265]|uniref:trypco2 family protein n=1 Tax=Actinoplanes sp. NPDC049265 TaxID=3363902 RepID=UPI00371A4BFE
MEWIGLAEAVQLLRDELTIAQDNGSDEALRFDVGTIEMEFSLVARRTGGGRAGVQFGIVTVGVDGAVSQESTHRVKVTLQPKEFATGRAPQVSGRADTVPDR